MAIATTILLVAMQVLSWYLFMTAKENRKNGLAMHARS